jgi:3-deoxy-D-manno-octulosonate 8-phosphate phosphatase (KDO 8-P phosphatase)
MRRKLRKSDVSARAGRVRLLVLDVDGVLTDGRIFFGPSGEEVKAFHVRDGSAIGRAIEAGIEVALISGRQSPAVLRRARELGIREVFQGVRDKTAIFRDLARRPGRSPATTAVIGDDLPDRSLLEAAGFAATPADGHPDLDASVHYRCRERGGRGAVREVIDLILECARTAAKSNSAAKKLTKRKNGT